MIKFLQLKFVVLKHHSIEVTCEAVLEEGESVRFEKRSLRQFIVPASEVFYKDQVEYLLNGCLGVALGVFSGVDPFEVESAFIEDDVVQPELGLDHSTGSHDLAF